MKKYFLPPFREYIFLVLLLIGLALSFSFIHSGLLLAVASGLAVLPTFWSALKSLYRRKISIDVFNSFAVSAAFFTGEVRSAAFIALMLVSARLLDHYTERRSHNAVEELLKLKPSTAIKEEAGQMLEVPALEVQPGDTLVVKTGSRVPADGEVIYGEALFNESSLTGESAMVKKAISSQVYSSTLNETGMVKIRVTQVGKDSTLEKMARLIEEASKNKSSTEKLADKFAAIFLPLVLGAGLLTYLLTHNINMVIGLFLVACADDVAVSIPLAMTASLGFAAKRGVIIKGGQYLDALGRINTLVIDKTGTLTYGELKVAYFKVEEWVNENEFWRALGSVEKYSEHPAGKAIFEAAGERVKDFSDPEGLNIVKGQGACAKTDGKFVAVGNEALFAGLKINLPDSVFAAAEKIKMERSQTVLLVCIDSKYAGLICLGDTPRKEASVSIARLKSLGVKRVIMFTGDNAQVAAQVAKNLGIEEFRAGMLPENKLSELEKLPESYRPVAMVGDGINDAPALARADVGIAMGSTGTAVAVEAADVVIIGDDLTKLSEMVALGRRTSRVVWGDMFIWFITNGVGFALVLTGTIGPALAALYNFFTDFLPLINSARLFRGKADAGLKVREGI